MKMKKILAGFVASAFAAASLALGASAAAVPDGKVIVVFADADWKIGIWGRADDTADWTALQTPADITGNGSYSVSVDLSAGYQNETWLDEETGDILDLTTANRIGAMGLGVWGLEETAGINITSVSFDGVDYPLIASSYTNDEDEGKRTNIYNEWASFDAATHLSADPANAAGRVIDITNLAEWTTCTVTFDVYGMTEAAAATPDTGEITVSAGDTAAASVADKGSADTGIEGVAFVTALGIIAAGAIVVSRKRK